MVSKFQCFHCGRMHRTKEAAVRCHNAHVQEIEKHPNPPRIRWWAGR